VHPIRSPLLLFGARIRELPVAAPSIDLTAALALFRNVPLARLALRRHWPRLRASTPDEPCSR
jgi:hypothetical protein